MSRTKPSRYEKVKVEVDRLCATTHRDKTTHAEWLAGRGRIYAMPEWDKLTRRDKDYFNGKMMGASDLAWVYTYWAFDVDGVVVKYGDATPEQKEKIHKDSDKLGHHYWVGTTKRWT